MSDDRPVYISGPMFSPADHWAQSKIDQVLTAAGHTSYLPQRDGFEIGPLIDRLRNPIVQMTFFKDAATLIQKAGFCLDLYQLLQRCGSVVFNMNGRVPDEGSVVEVTAAFTAGVPLVIYKNTPISMLGGFDNPMVTGLTRTWTYCETVEEIPAALATAVSSAPAGYTFQPPPYLADYLKAGEEVYANRDAIRDAIQKVAELTDDLPKHAVELAMKAIKELLGHLPLK